MYVGCREESKTAWAGGVSHRDGEARSGLRYAECGFFFYSFVTPTPYI